MIVQYKTKAPKLTRDQWKEIIEKWRLRRVQERKEHPERFVPPGFFDDVFMSEETIKDMEEWKSSDE